MNTGSKAITTFSTATVIAIGMTATMIVLAPVSVDARQSTRNFTCQGVQNYVRQRGSAVLNTKSSRVYRRFVANRSHCSAFEITETRTVPTKTGVCYLRICWEPLSRGDRFIFRRD